MHLYSEFADGQRIILKTSKLSELCIDKYGLLHSFREDEKKLFFKNIVFKTGKSCITELPFLITSAALCVNSADIDFC